MRFVAAFTRVRPRDRRALIVGAVAAVPALAWSFAVKPYIAGLRAERDALEVQRGLLARELGAIAAAPRTPAELARSRASLATERKRLFSGDGITAASGLATYVKGAVEESSLVLQQLESHDNAAPSAAGIRTITLEMRVEGDLRGILDMLSTLESGERLVRVSRIGIERSAASAANGAEALTLSATVQGFAESTGGHQ